MLTLDELTKKFETLTTSVDTMKKDFELKLESAKKDAEQWKTVATQKDEDLKKFKQEAETANKEKEKAYAEKRKQEDKIFLENLKKQGKLTPASQEIATKLMESMTSETVVATFEAKDGKKITHTQLSLFKELLGSLAKSPIFSQMSRTDVAERETPDGDQEKQF